MKSKQRKLWEIVSNILETHGDQVDGISIHEYTDAYDNESVKIYCSQGYCFELSKEQYDEDEVSDVEDGFLYSFAEPWDGFNKAGIDRALDILADYGKEVPSE